MYKGRIERFEIPRGYSVYNPTAPFTYKGKVLIGVRYEPIDNEFDSSIVFFEKNDKDIWVQNKDLNHYNLQDPFIIKYDNEFILGGVEAENNDTQTFDYKTIIYKGTDLNHLEQIYEGPNKMKGIRFVKLRNGKIALLVRPQITTNDDPYGRGRISFSLIDNLDQITTGIVNAESIDGLFSKFEWGGNNEVYELENGDIGILGHKSYFSTDGNKNYYAIAIQYDYLKRKVVLLKTIVERESFPEFQPKKPELRNVIYTAGMVKNSKPNKYRLYAGISDVAVGSIEIENPFTSQPIQTLS